MALILLLRLCAPLLCFYASLITLIGYSRRLWSGSWDGAVVLWAKQHEADSEPACEWAPCFQCKPARSRPVLALVVLTLPLPLPCPYPCPYHPPSTRRKLNAHNAMT